MWLFQMPLIVVLAVLFPFSSSNDCVGSTYRDFEKLILSTSNVKILEESFYPINIRTKDIVIITYKFSLSSKGNRSELVEYLNSNSGITFYWLSSPVHLVITKERLHKLSLLTYNPKASNITLQVNLDSLCATDFQYVLEEMESIDSSNDTEAFCEGGNYLLDVFNNFSAHALMYALGKRSLFDEVIQPHDRGYSVFNHNPNLDTYCVLQHQGVYLHRRYILLSGSLLMIIFTVLAFPVLFARLYDSFIEKLRGPSGSEYWRYITWSVLFVSLLVNCLAIANNTMVLMELIEQYEFSRDVFSFFVFLFSVFCFGVWIVDIIGASIAIAYIYRDRPNEFNTRIPPPVLLGKFLKKFECCCEFFSSCNRERDAHNDEQNDTRDNSNLESGNNNPTDPEHGHSDPIDPQHDQQTVDPQHGQSDPGNPQHGQSDPQHSQSDLTDPQHGQSDPGNPQHGQSDPQHGQSDLTDPQHGQSDPVDPEHNHRDSTNPESQRGNPTNTRHDNNSTRHLGRCAKCIALAFGYTIIVHFLQIISFHVVYIMLGAIAAPTETLSVLCSFITAYLFAVIYVAIILKFLDKDNYFKKNLCLDFTLCILPLSVAGIALIVSIALFTAFFYSFNIVMEITSRSEGLWGVVKSFLPALFVAFLGFCGSKLLTYIEPRKRDATSESDSSKESNSSEERDSLRNRTSIPHSTPQSSHCGSPPSSHDLPTQNETRLTTEGESSSAQPPPTDQTSSSLSIENKTEASPTYRRKMNRKPRSSKFSRKKGGCEESELLMPKK